jgi:hypothetical protein
MKNYKQMSSAAKDLDKAVNAAKADLEPIKDDVEEHREINEKIGSIYSCSDQLSIFRHTLKLLLDKNKITFKEFEDFNTVVDSIVTEVKSHNHNN